MKKSVFFASLLAGLLLVGCGQKNEEQKPDPKPNPDEETVKPDVKPDEKPDVKPDEKPAGASNFGDTELVGALAADYDFTAIEGVWNEDPSKSTIYFGKDTSVDIKDQFTNKVSGSSINIESVMTGTQGIERAQKTQGPKIGGIKLNNKDGNNTDTYITIKFAAGVSVDQIVIEMSTWPAKGKTLENKLTINDKEIVIPKDSAMAVKVGVAADNMNEIKIAVTKGRPIITGIKLYNK